MTPLYELSCTHNGDVYPIIFVQTPDCDHFIIGEKFGRPSRVTRAQVYLFNLRHRHRFPFSAADNIVCDMIN